MNSLYRLVVWVRKGDLVILADTCMLQIPKLHATSIRLSVMQNLLSHCFIACTCSKASRDEPPYPLFHHTPTRS
jgi:hypothetical protein